MKTQSNYAFALALALALPVAAAAEAAKAEGAAAAQDPAAAQQAVLDELAAGNQAFVEGSSGALPDVGPARRQALATGQRPKAIVLGCADSRVPPEHLFREGLGDLFVVRVAGNLPVSGAIGSIEYAAEHLGTEVLVVLGHSSCGAVKAAVSGAHAKGDLAQLVHAIDPAVKRARLHVGANASEDVLLADAVHENARLAAQSLVQKSPVLKERVQSGHLKVVVGLYDLASGKVAFEPVDFAAQKARAQRTH